MKVWKFKIKEYYFGGTKDSELEVKARTEKSAFKKVYEIQGNRDWSIELIRSNKMSKPKHTPGPFEYYKDTMQESDANLALIAAAPELLQALKDVLEYANSDGQIGKFLMDNKILEIIKKAEGKE